MWSVILFCTSLIIISNAETMNDKAHCVANDGSFVSHGVTDRYDGTILQCLNGTFSQDPRCGTIQSYSLGETTIDQGFQFKCTFLPDNKSMVMRLIACQGDDGVMVTANNGEHFTRRVESVPFQLTGFYICKLNEDGGLINVGFNVSGEFVHGKDQETFSRRLVVGNTEYYISFPADGKIHIQEVQGVTRTHKNLCKYFGRYCPRK